MLPKIKINIYLLLVICLIFTAFGMYFFINDNHWWVVLIGVGMFGVADCLEKIIYKP